MPAKQTIVKITSTKTRTVTKTKTKRKSSGKKRGNPNRCPTCGRFM